MKLSVEALHVDSFDTGSVDQANQAMIGGGSVYPMCIVYVSDCVSCPPEQEYQEFQRQY